MYEQIIREKLEMVNFKVQQIMLIIYSSESVLTEW